MSYPREVEFSELRSGDKVELTNTVNGDVIHTKFESILLYTASPGAWTYRLLARQERQVGDIIGGLAVFDLPIGSVVTNTLNPNAVWVVVESVTKDKYVISPFNTVLSQRRLQNSRRYTINYIPKSRYDKYETEGF